MWQYHVDILRIVIIIAEEVITIFHNEKDITKGNSATLVMIVVDFNSAIANWYSANYFEAGFYVGKIVGILLDKH